jgi:hypothetical protein
MNNPTSLLAEHPLQPHECDYSVEVFRVVWREPSGQYRRSRACESLEQAIERSARHDWPYAILREYRVETIEVIERG